MKLLSFVSLVAASSSTEIYDSKTILSITSNGAFFDVQDLPQRLEAAKLASNPAMAAFLKTAKIKTLNSADLCAYVKDAASKLPDLEYECSPNFATKEEGMH
ncbi:Suppressor of the cold-sensitive snRNP bioproteinsis mutant brr1-1 [Perkinsus olseni]|uniref:Suppressor of the cold-sensitive snRNP bioproteinsis mutant brr1-1 n=1 Tax=Perkinsus olseni TaxID=32597 RepID=A0A7J6QFG3_PEROL|nr:Suppressor of the cold-sensitive snRNP bioproteinsis mutant brr1-1 [Perkinsus olseni]